MDMVDTGPSTSQIPNLIKIGSVATDQSISVQTDVIDPVIFSQREARFVLENKGILHSNSRITFAGTGSASNITAGARTFFPAGVGINSIIQRCSLRVGTKTICEIEDFADFTAYETNFLPPDAIKEREGVLSGRMVSIAPRLQDRGAAFQNASDATLNVESLTQAKTIGVDNGIDVVLTADQTNVRDPVLGTAAVDESTGIIWDYQETTNKPTYSILLADLFPFLKLNQLPLYMMSEQVSIHLTFTTQAATGLGSSRVSTTQGQNATLANDCTLDRNQCQMVADYIYYPQDMMEQYRQANSDMTFTYVDYDTVRRTVGAVEYAGGLIQNLGGAGRIVNKVFVSFNEDDRNEQSDNLLNKYFASSPAITDQSISKATLNLKYNDNFLYPIDVSNPARQYHNVFSAEGRVPFISRDLYRGEGQLADGATLDGAANFEGYEAVTDLAGMFFYTAYRLNKGERVNSRGIELYDTRTGINVSGGTMRAWIQVVRVANLRDGIFTTGYA